MLAFAIRVVSLWLSVSTWPDVRPPLVAPAVAAAVIAETAAAPAELLLALAWGESRFESWAQPACGVMQVFPADLELAPELAPSACVAWRGSLVAGFAAGAEELRIELADARVHGDLRRALLYRACGNVGLYGGCTDAKLAWVDAALTRYQVLR